MHALQELKGSYLLLFPDVAIILKKYTNEKGHLSFKNKNISFFSFLLL